MDWYALRTISGREPSKLLLLERLFPEYDFVFPKRRLSWRKGGRTLQIVKPLFRGYLFAIAEPDRIAELDSWLRGNPVGVSCVRSGDVVRPIGSNEALVLKRLMDETHVVGTTQVEIASTGDKVRIVSGPLLGLDALVESWSRRDRRVAVRVELGGQHKRVFLAAEFLEVVERKEPAATAAVSNAKRLARR